MATPIRILSSMATKALLADLVARYPAAAEVDVGLISVGGVEAARRVEAGEAMDIVVLAANVIDQLTGKGCLVAGSRTDIVQSGVAIAVRKGEPAVDISSEASVKAAILAARSIGYSTGPSGVYLAKLFDRWGITEQIKDRIVLAPPGVPVGAFMAKGEVDLGFQQLSELMPIEGITILGPMPPAIQLMTTFSGGIAASSTQPDAARALLDYMVSADTAGIKQDNGMEPA